MPKFYRVVYAVLDTITTDESETSSEEDVRRNAEDIIRERDGCATDKGIIRITSHEEDVQNPITLKDVIKVQEPLRRWPSPAAIAAHKKNGGRWLCEREMMFGPPVVRIDVFYENGVFTDYQRKGCVSPPLKFGPVDIDYNRMPWPKDKEGNLL